MTRLPGQIETTLPDGLLALSCAKPVEEGARAALLLAPGRFRLDVRPTEDAMMIAVRPLASERCSWQLAVAPEQRSDPLPSGVHSLTIEGERWSASVTIGSVHDRRAALTRFVAQALVSARAP